MNYEINGNLYEKKTGLKNVNMFQSTILKVINYYTEKFGEELLSNVPLYIDNATENSGYTPVTTKVLNEIIIIKLGISTEDPESKIAYQFSHEFMHYTFYSIFGLGKPHADDFEESICSAASLIVIKDLYPDSFDSYKKHVEGLANADYRAGAEVANNVGYDFAELVKLIKLS